MGRPFATWTKSGDDRVSRRQPDSSRVRQLPMLISDMPWSPRRGFLSNVWGLCLDALLLVFVVAIIVRGCTLIIAPVDVALDPIADGLNAGVEGRP